MSYDAYMYMYMLLYIYVEYRDLETSMSQFRLLYERLK